MRQRARKDANQAAIVAALRMIGVAVVVINQKGVPDLLTHRGGIWLPIEVKTPKGRLTFIQKRFREIAPFPVVRTVEEALQLFQVRS